MSLQYNNHVIKFDEEEIIGSVYGHGYMRESHDFKIKDLYPHIKELLKEGRENRFKLEAFEVWLEKWIDQDDDLGNIQKVTLQEVLRAFKKMKIAEVTLEA